MPDNPTFVVNDRRKFTAEGELRPEARTEEAARTPEAQSTVPPETAQGPQLVAQPEEPSPTANDVALADLPESSAVGALEDETFAAPVQADPAAEFDGASDELLGAEGAMPGPTPEQAAEAARAYEATVDRLDTAMRAANPGGERVPPMSFERFIQSLYTQALILLGGGAQPGETPRVDILGARDTIDMLALLQNKSQGNLSQAEQQLLDSALFDLRMGFLEITQALARQAAQRQGGTAPGGSPAGFAPTGAGPRIVR